MTEKEQAMQKLNQDLENRISLQGLLKEVYKQRESLKKLDGKIINKKLETALKLINKSIDHHRSHVWLIHDNNNPIINTRYNDIESYFEVGNEKTLNSANKEVRRFDFHKTVENLLEEINNVGKKVEQAKKNISDYDNMIKDFEEIESKLKDFRNNYNPYLIETVSKYRIYL